MILTAGSFSFLAIRLCHKSARHFCITFHIHSELLPNDLWMFLFRVNIRQLRQEKKDGFRREKKTSSMWGLTCIRKPTQRSCLPHHNCHFFDTSAHFFSGRKTKQYLRLLHGILFQSTIQPRRGHNRRRFPDHTLPSYLLSQNG